MPSIAVTREMSKLMEHAKKCSIGEAQNKDIAAAISARLVGFKLPLPTQPVKPPVESWYMEQAHAIAAKYVEEINESFVIDVEATMLLIRNIWRTRYNMVFEPFSLESVMSVCGVLSNNAKIAPIFSEVYSKLYSGEHKAEANYMTDQLTKAVDEYVRIS